MRAEDFRLGMRVRRRSADGAFVRDRTGTPRRVGIVVGMPETINNRHRGVRIQHEGSTRIEMVLIHRLEPLPLEQQPMALGGQWQPPDGTFLPSAKKSAPAKR